MRERGIKASELIPSEAREQQTVAEWLDAHRICWFHPANETGIAHGYGLRRKMARAGVKPGVPDIVIINPPLAYEFRTKYGAVIELKKKRGGVLTPNQEIWLNSFINNTWVAAVCKGADEAIKQLEAWGYGK